MKNRIIFFISFRMEENLLKKFSIRSRQLYIIIFTSFKKSRHTQGINLFKWRFVGKLLKRWIGCVFNRCQIDYSRPHWSWRVKRIHFKRYEELDIFPRIVRKLVIVCKYNTNQCFVHSIRFPKTFFIWRICYVPISNSFHSFLICFKKFSNI